jgi:N utilization substance protein B
MEERMKRRELRENIFRLLFRVEFNDQEGMAEQVSLFAEDMKEENKADEKDEAYISEKYERIAKKLPELDAMLNEASKSWKTSRMGKVDLTILRLALFEMKFDDDIPEKVAINEAVELSKKFGGDESPAFINGVLAKLAEN